MKSFASLTMLICVCITTPALAGLVAAGNVHTGWRTYDDSIVLTEFSCLHWPMQRGSARFISHSGAYGSGSHAGGGIGGGGTGGGLSAGSPQGTTAAVNDVSVTPAAAGIEDPVAHPTPLAQDDQIFSLPPDASSQPLPPPFTPGIDDQITRRFDSPFTPGIDDQISPPSGVTGAGAPSDDPLVGGPTPQEIVDALATDPNATDFGPELPDMPGSGGPIEQAQPVPEPGTAALLVLGLMALGPRWLSPTRKRD